MNKDIIGVYLAAGESRRMGCNKLMLPLGKGTIGSAALHALLHSQIDRSLIVVKGGDDLSWIAPDLFQGPRRDKWEPIECQDSRKGMSYSLKCAVAAAEQRGAQAIMVLLADQPGVSVQMLDELLSQLRLYSQDVTTPIFYAYTFEGLPRPPVLIRREAFSRIYRLEGDEGARKLIRASAPHEVRLVESTAAKHFVDVDTYEEYTVYKDEDSIGDFG